MSKDPGLQQRYEIRKANGEKVHPEAKYFVLRYDGFGDHCHVEASRKALKKYAREIEPYLPQLAEALFIKLERLEGKK